MYISTHIHTYTDYIDYIIYTTIHIRTAGGEETTG